MLNLIFIILITSFIAEFILDYLNIRNWSTVPEMLRDVYSEEKYDKARAYARTYYRFSQWSALFSLLLLSVCLLTGLFGTLDQWIRQWTDSPVLIAMGFFFILGFASDILSLPFSLYKTFVIEEKFGFNKTTPKTFLLDKLKGYLVAIILGGAIIAILVKVYEMTGMNFWWIAWLFLSVLMLLLTMFYTSILLPLFNKLTPLPEGELRSAIEEYSRKTDFPLQNIFIMDGSKRSSKANAFFSGLGRKKKIVLFDTLIEQHTTEELVAVLAHEAGHYKMKHTRTSLLAGLLQTGIMFFVFSLLQGNPALYQALNAQSPGLHLELLTFGLLYSPVSAVTGILMHIVSRKHEYEADAFAKKTYDGTALAHALKKLSAENLSNLTPHPAYVFVHYSHPTLLSRLKALQSA